MAAPIRELAGVDARDLPPALLESSEPLVVRGLVPHWPLVEAARLSPAAFSSYLLRCYGGTKVKVLFAPPEAEGRFFYNDDLSGFNFRHIDATLDAFLADLARAARDPRPPAIYIGSESIDACLPGLRAENDLAFGPRDRMINLWVGNRTRIAAHHDLPTNLACVVAGRRRFTLFPPEQVENLYVGPLDFTLARQAVSLVDFARPDFGRFPKFADALAAARVTELAPGDALLIPSLWWHYVEGLESFNALVNYWWVRTPVWRGAPMGAMLHAMLTMRDLPAEQRAAWQAMFRHYVFEAGDETVAHIPPGARGVLGPLDDEAAKKLRATIQSMLGR
jgi:hypothetical protein